jgi:hypothetical protein
MGEETIKTGRCLTMWKALAVVLLLCVAPEEAFAYLDPGTGSMVLQLILGGLAGLVVLVKLYWRRVMTYLFGRRAQGPESTRSSTEVGKG